MEVADRNAQGHLFFRKLFDAFFQYLQRLVVQILSHKYLGQLLIIPALRLQRDNFPDGRFRAVPILAAALDIDLFSQQYRVGGIPFKLRFHQFQRFVKIAMPEVKVRKHQFRLGGVFRVKAEELLQDLGSFGGLTRLFVELCQGGKYRIVPSPVPVVSVKQADGFITLSLPEIYFLDRIV